MTLAETYAPKKTFTEDADCVSGLFFCSLEEGLKDAASRYPCGKLLFFTDEKNYTAFAEQITLARAVSVCFSGKDALPLFALHDGVTAIFAAGGADVMRSARYYAAVKRIGCVLFPMDARLIGVLEEEAEICVNGTSGRVSLSQATVYCDIDRLQPTLSRAYARLLLFRLATVERRAIDLFERTCSNTDDAFRATLAPSSGWSARELILRNATLSRIGALGEGEVLARVLEKEGDQTPEWTAFVLLSALYGAFFTRGAPAKYVVPNYKERLKKVGREEDYARLHIPTGEEMLRRSQRLERARKSLITDFKGLFRGDEEREYFRFGGAPAQTLPVQFLFRLPEYAEGGLSCYLRDFGLLEKE